MDRRKDFGVAGEKDICRILRKVGYPVRKSDGHIYLNGEYCAIEVKNKTRPWRPPPFYGHGLNKDQWEHYLDFQNQTGMRILLFIKCNGTIIWNYIDELAKSKTHITPKKKIIVFPIEKFRPFKELAFNE